MRKEDVEHLRRAVALGKNICTPGYGPAMDIEPTTRNRANIGLQFTGNCYMKGKLTHVQDVYYNGPSEKIKVGIDPDHVNRFLQGATDMAVRVDKTEEGRRITIGKSTQKWGKPGGLEWSEYSIRCILVKDPEFISPGQCYIPEAKPEKPEAPPTPIPVVEAKAPPAVAEKPRKGHYEYWGMRAVWVPD
ncbi:MAG: hypothetical protein JRD89_00540 [Deltaproteobacteria bacterium]|nr:hypothetical protein [Deltaproteobacteria bacterium]